MTLPSRAQSAGMSQFRVLPPAVPLTDRKNPNGGETVDVTEHGRLIARIVPVGECEPTPILARLVESGRGRLAPRPGYRPRTRSGDGSNRLSGILAAIRDEER